MAQESFIANMNFDNDGNMPGINNYGFYGGVALAKLEIPEDVYISSKSASWTGSINNDWFNAGNWAENMELIPIRK